MTTSPSAELWRVWLWRSALALIWVAIGLVVFYNWVRVREVYTLNRHVEQMRSEIQVLRQSITGQDAINAARIDQLERTLFGDVLNKLEAEKRSNVVALWQKNRDSELRDRILRLERWRMEMERDRSREP